MDPPFVVGACRGETDIGSPARICANISIPISEFTWSASAGRVGGAADLRRPLARCRRSPTVSAPALTLRSIRAGAVVLKLARPVIARIATITGWPVVLIDLETEQGIVGRSYLEPYTAKT